MKVVGFQSDKGLRLGVVEGDQVIDLQEVDSRIPSDLAEVLQKDGLSSLADAAKKAKLQAAADKAESGIAATSLATAQKAATDTAAMLKTDE